MVTVDVCTDSRGELHQEALFGRDLFFMILSKSPTLEAELGESFHEMITVLVEFRVSSPRGRSTDRSKHSRDVEHVYACSSVLLR